MANPQSPALKRCLAGLAVVQLGRAAAASAAARQTLDLRSRLRTSLVTLKIMRPDKLVIPLWKRLINISYELEAQTNFKRFKPVF